MDIEKTNTAVLFIDPQADADGRCSPASLFVAVVRHWASS